MSSILDALDKLESRSPGGPGGPPPKRPRRWLPVVAAVAIAFVAGVLVMRYVGDRDASTDATVVAAAPPASRPAGRLIETEPAATPGPTTRPAPVVPRASLPTTTRLFDAKPLPTTTVRPGPTVARPPTTAPAPPTRHPPITTLPAPPTTLPMPPTTLPAPPTTLRTPPTTLPVAARPTPPPAPSRRPAGAPDIRVSFLLYSADPDRRSAALTIEGGSTSTVREGEYFQAVLVLEILPEAVDLEWSGIRYRVPARR